MNIQDFAKNFGKNRDFNKKQSAPQDQPQKKTAQQQVAQPAPDVVVQPSYTPELKEVSDDCILVVVDGNPALFINGQGNLYEHSVEGFGEDGVFLCRAEAWRCTPSLITYKVKDLHTPQIQTHTTPWGQHFGWYSLPKLTLDVGVGKSNVLYRQRYSPAIEAYERWKEWGMAAYQNRDETWNSWFASEDGKAYLLDLLVSGVEVQEFDCLHLTIKHFVSHFRNVIAEVEIRFRNAHVVAPFLPRRKAKTPIDTQSKMPESIVPTHSRYSQRGTHSEGMSFFDGRWVRDSEAGWCDPDWTSGD